MILKDPYEKRYNLIVATNIVFLFVLISYVIYFNPFGFFTLPGSDPAPLQPYQIKLVIGFMVTAIASNLIVMKHYIKNKVKKGRM